MMNRKIINKFFGQFGTVFVDWPVKQKPNSRGKSIAIGSYSYLFLVYSDEQSVIKLMSACHRNSQNDFFVSVPGFRDMIQIRPWFIYNGFYILEKARHNRIIDIHRTVFLGGLPRIVTAEEIAQMFSEFGVVLLVTIDIDQDYGYPKGAARVTFERDSAFNRALEKKFLKFDNIDSSKTMIEIKPYVMEDVGCDECGGLWFNPFLSIYDHLKCAKDDHQKEQKMAEIKNFNMWSSRSPFSLNSGDGHDDLITKMDAGFKKNCNLACTYSNRENEKNETEMGARKFLEMVKSFGLEKEKTVTVNGNEYPIGPDLWDKFLPAPKYDVGTEPVRMNPEAKLQQFLRMKRTNVYSNKSAYCKEAPCRQYYCPSCSNKLHSGPNQHTLLPAGKPERRPRKDKNMYLVNMGK
ncbi:RRM domain-containing protein [Caenorhabditis elegans]|nr:RRM domain-containing protein [Caenorhabditis elegans]CCD72821.1 RRM domain-containing protein [Caenorhabditis elegans]|eukprot:NP_001021791.1 Feminization Of Germline [Caenorhabditis elegans]